MTSDVLQVNAVNGALRNANADKLGATVPVNGARCAVPSPVAYVAAPNSEHAMLLTCPKCKGHDVSPLRSHSSLERILTALSLPTYHCDNCSSRFRHLTTHAELRMLKREVLLRSAIRSLGSQTSL
jgi:Zn finger protein HypA/HybF involved in hydrogenase expression